MEDEPQHVSGDLATAAVGSGGPRRPSLQLGDVASHRFLFVREDLGPRRAGELIKALEPERVILRSGAPGRWRHHLLAAGEVLPLLEDSEEETAGAVAAELPAVPAIDAAAEADEAPDRCVVLAEGEPVGFFDVESEVADVQRGSGSPDLEPEVVARLLVAEMERRVAAGEAVSLLVSLAAPDLAEEAGLPVALAVGSQVDLYLRARDGVEVEGPRELSLTVTDERETLPVRFRLRAGSEPAEARVDLLAFLGGSCLGQLTLPLTVALAPPPASRPLRHERELIARLGPEPDLTLSIRELGDPDRPELTFRFWSASVQGRTYGPVRLRTDPREYFTDFFRDLDKLGDGDAAARARTLKRLQRKGAELFEKLLPEELRLLLWLHRDRVETLRVESEEPWIPWELCRLVGTQDGRKHEGGFLCEEFQIGRWIAGIPPRTRLSVRRAGLIAPATGSAAPRIETGAGPADGDGIRGLLESHGACVDPIACRYVPLLEALSSGKYDALHFAGHGAFRAGDPDCRSQILLDGFDVLTPEDLSGEIANLGLPGPLVFLNACETARTGHSLTELGGWAPRFLEAGAVAFLGTLWPVSDRGAEVFARTFYDALLDARRPIGDAVRRARKAVYRELPGNPSWLAYSLYADPLARLTDGAPETANAAQ